MGRSGAGRRISSPEPFIANQPWEKWMKSVKISAIAFAMSAMLAGPALAQGASSDTQIRGGAQGMQGGASGSVDPGAPGQKAAVHAKTGAKGTVGAAGGTHKGNTVAPGDPAPAGRRN
jgi:hypothetical protein